MKKLMQKALVFMLAAMMIVCSVATTAVMASAADETALIPATTPTDLWTGDTDVFNESGEFVSASNASNKTIRSNNYYSFAGDTATVNFSSYWYNKDNHFGYDMTKVTVAGITFVTVDGDVDDGAVTTNPYIQVVGYDGTVLATQELADYVDLTSYSMTSNWEISFNLAAKTITYDFYYGSSMLSNTITLADGTYLTENFKISVQKKDNYLKVGVNELTISGFTGGEYTMPSDTNSHIYEVVDVMDYLKITGRTAVVSAASTAPVGQSLTLSNAAAGIHFNAYVTGDIVINADFKAGQAENFLTVYVDGVRADDRVRVASESGWANNTVTVVSGLAEGDHEISIYHANESALGSLYINTITMNGYFKEKPAEKEMFIEVLGDSITAGYGNIGEAYIPSGSDSTKTYAFVAAEQLDADLSVIAVSGNTFMGGSLYNGATVFSTDDQLANVCMHESSNGTFDTTKREPDVFVINLGTNDANFFSNGTQGFDAYTEDDLKAGVTALCQKVRAIYPNTTIVWYYGMMGYSYNSVIRAGVEAAALTDGNVYYYDVLRSNYDGGGGHPDEQACYDNGVYLAEIITDLNTPDAIAFTAKVENDAYGSVTATRGGEAIDLTTDTVYEQDVITLTAQANEGYAFKYWVNQTGLKVSEEATFDVTADYTSNYFVAVFEATTAVTVTVDIDDRIFTYIADAGVVSVNIEDVYSGSIQSFIDSFDEYKFINTWEVLDAGDNEGMAVGDWLEAGTAITGNITVKPLFQYVETYYQITVNGEALNPNGYRYDTKVTATDSAATYWEDVTDANDSYVISYETSYSFFVWGDRSLVSHSDETTAVPIIHLDTKIDTETDIISYLSERTVPGNAQIIRAGIIVGIGGVEADQLTVENINNTTIKAGYASGTEGNGQYIVKLKGVTNTDYSARAFIILSSGTVVYSDAIEQNFVSENAPIDPDTGIDGDIIIF